MTTCARELRRAATALATRTFDPESEVDLGGVRIVLSRPIRRTPWTYVGRVLLHPYNMLFVGSVLLLGFVGWSAFLLVVGLAAELAVLCVAPWRGPFRRRIDAQLDDLERAAALKEREARIHQMDLRHQQELARVDRLIDRTCDNIRRRGGDVPPLLDDGLGTDRLTESYIRLAIAHKTGHDCLAMTNHDELCATIRALEALRGGASERVRRLSDRRLAIARRRAECWRRTREGLEVVAHQLATIVDLAHLLHEQSTVPLDSPAACAEIDRLVREVDESDRTLREIDELAAEQALELDRLDDLDRLDAPRAGRALDRYALDG